MPSLPTAVMSKLDESTITSTSATYRASIDPLVLSATYIQAVSHAEVDVRIGVLKRGKSLSNVQAELRPALRGEQEQEQEQDIDV